MNNLLEKVPDKFHIRVEADIPFMLELARRGYLPTAIASKTGHDKDTVKKVLKNYHLL